MVWMNEREAVDETSGQCNRWRHEAAGGKDQSDKEDILGHDAWLEPLDQAFNAIDGGHTM
jgi:hypothetical protein